MADGDITYRLRETGQTPVSWRREGSERRFAVDPGLPRRSAESNGKPTAPTDTTDSTPSARKEYRLPDRASAVGRTFNSCPPESTGVPEEPREPHDCTRGRISPCGPIILLLHGRTTPTTHCSNVTTVEDSNGFLRRPLKKWPSDGVRSRMKYCLGPISRYITSTQPWRVAIN